MIKEEFGIGATIEEAKNQAVSKLNCGDADYQIEIIEDVKPKILGLFGGHPAKVRAYYECPDPKPTKKAKNNKKQDSKKSKSKKDSPAQKTDKESEETLWKTKKPPFLPLGAGCPSIWGTRAFL